MGKGGGKPERKTIPAKSSVSGQFAYSLENLRHSAFVTGPTRWNQGFSPRPGDTFVLIAYGLHRTLKIVSVDSRNGLAYVQDVKNGQLLSPEESQ